MRRLLAAITASLLLGLLAVINSPLSASAGFSSLKICHFAWVGNVGTYVQVFEPYGADNSIFLDDGECTTVNDSDNGVHVYIYGHSFRWRPTGGYAWSGCYNSAPGTYDVGATYNNVQYRTFQRDGCTGDH